MVALLLAVAMAAAKPSPIVFDANRLPQYAGEIYRSDPNGTRVDLSRSPGEDFAPAVSPNGKLVAFAQLAPFDVGDDAAGNHLELGHGNPTAIVRSIALSELPTAASCSPSSSLAI